MIIGKKDKQRIEYLKTELVLSQDKINRLQAEVDFLQDQLKQKESLKPNKAPRSPRVRKTTKVSE